MEDDLEMELELAGEFPQLDDQLDADEQEPMPPEELSDARPETDTAGRSSWHPVGELWKTTEYEQKINITPSAVYIIPNPSIVRPRIDRWQHVPPTFPLNTSTM